MGVCFRRPMDDHELQIAGTDMDDGVVHVRVVRLRLEQRAAAART